MSLEEKIETLTAAIESLTEQVKTQNATVAKALGAKADTSKGDDGTPVATKSTSTKATKSTSTKTNKKADGPPTQDDLLGVFGPYLAGASDLPTKKALIETIKPLLEYFGVERISQVDESQRAEAIGYGKQLTEAFADGGLEAAQGVKFDFMQDDGTDEGEGEDGSVL